MLAAVDIPLCLRMRTTIRADELAHDVWLDIRKSGDSPKKANLSYGVLKGAGRGRSKNETRERVQERKRKLENPHNRAQKAAPKRPRRRNNSEG